MLDLYRRRLSNQGRHMGEALKKQSDTIMNETFTRDIAYRVCYIDSEPVDAKYLVYTYASLSSDAVDYHLQFRPGVHFPIGKYVDIPDDVGEYHRWLIVGRSDEPQFVKYNILKCNWTFKWVIDGEIKEVLGCLRKRLSYNAGLWLDYLATIPENQTQIIVPYNQDTETIYYNQRFLISVNQINPMAWEVSKVEDITMPGLIYITLKQDLYDPSRDNAELMIADYYKSNIEPSIPEEIIQPTIKIKYSNSPVIKVGGSYKIFHFDLTNEINTDLISWVVDGLEPNDYTFLQTLTQMKIKADKNYNLIGSVFTLKLLYNGQIADSIQVEVIGL